MRILYTAALTAIAALTLSAGVAAQDDQPAPVISEPQISPDGTRLALIQSSGDANGVVFSTIGSGEPPRGIGIGDAQPRELRWVANDRVILLATYTTRSATRSGLRTFDVDRWSSFSPDGGEPSYLFSASREFENALDAATFISTLPDNDDSILMSHRRTDFQQDVRNTGTGFRMSKDKSVNSDYNLYTVDIETGREKDIERGDEETVAWITDRDGRAMAHVNVDKGANKQIFYLRRDGEDRFRRASELPLNDDDTPAFDVVTYGDGPAAVIGLRRGENGVLGLEEYDMATGAFGAVVFRHESADIETVKIDPATRALVAATYQDGVLQSEIFDDTLRARQSAIAAALQGASVSIASYATDKNRLVIRADYENAPAEYFLYDDAAKSLAGLGRAE